MRFALCALTLLSACQSTSQPDVRRDPSGAIADQSTSDEGPRGVEPNNSTGNVPPAAGSYELPGSRARQVAQEEQARRGGPDQTAEGRDAGFADGGLAVVAAIDEAGPCQSDDDCTASRVPPGACCATLCDARPMTKARAAELQDHYASCKNCPSPLCRPSRTMRLPACVEGRCKMKAVDTN